MQLLDGLKRNKVEIEKGSTRSHYHFGAGCIPDVKVSLRGDVEVIVENGGKTAHRQQGTVRNDVIVTLRQARQDKRIDFETKTSRIQGDTSRKPNRPQRTLATLRHA